MVSETIHFGIAFLKLKTIVMIPESIVLIKNWVKKASHSQYCEPYSGFGRTGGNITCFRWFMREIPVKKGTGALQLNPTHFFSS